ncbi:unnamed protein product [Medioppia subpectinata]|uniref:Uncharacterized protein n=1 Tax=Medioppia subpectinata TaxID=1979941 RepID=A0A7R9LR39_9ACAR|nr:unnamed protein product [Medioppia subpectinata]CAG2120981.1 unnamed protein product [Medioppia subpectinata]
MVTIITTITTTITVMVSAIRTMTTRRIPVPSMDWPFTAPTDCTHAQIH